MSVLELVLLGSLLPVLESVPLGSLLPVVESVPLGSLLPVLESVLLGSLPVLESVLLGSLLWSGLHRLLPLILEFLSCFQPRPAPARTGSGTGG
jgi:hypothetical protein